jgi:hypothetical protein
LVVYKPLPTGIEGVQFRNPNAERILAEVEYEHAYIAHFLGPAVPAAPVPLGQVVAEALAGALASNRPMHVPVHVPMCDVACDTSDLASYIFVSDANCQTSESTSESSTDTDDLEFGDCTGTACVPLKVLEEMAESMGTVNKIRCLDFGERTDDPKGLGPIELERLSKPELSIDCSRLVKVRLRRRGLKDALNYPKSNRLTVVTVFGPLLTELSLYTFGRPRETKLAPILVSFAKAWLQQNFDTTTCDPGDLAYCIMGGVLAAMLPSDMERVYKDMCKYKENRHDLQSFNEFYSSGTVHGWFGIPHKALNKHMGATSSK